MLPGQKLRAVDSATLVVRNRIMPAVHRRLKSSRYLLKAKIVTVCPGEVSVNVRWEYEEASAPRRGESLVVAFDFCRNVFGSCGAVLFLCSLMVEGSTDDAWVFVARGRDTKLIPSYVVGRNREPSSRLLADLQAIRRLRAAPTRKGGTRRVG